MGRLLPGSEWFLFRFKKAILKSESIKHQLIRGKMKPTGIKICAALIILVTLSCKKETSCQNLAIAVPI